ncbi:MAG TPA: type II toxin-antitoxin system RelE/ParE family toxin [Thermoleophilia bacterium]|nr:type II toxin-antitoxin system RelE/ParE family toxin [Thermoleophilia bacterium]
MAYSIVFTAAAERELRRLTLPGRVMVSRTLERLAANPRRPGVRRIVGADHLYRAKAGDYRVVYAIHEERVVICVVRIAHRGSVYRRIDRLPPGGD